MFRYTSSTLDSLLSVINSNILDFETRKKAYVELNKTVQYIPRTVFIYSFTLFLLITLIFEFILNTILAGFEPVSLLTIGVNMLIAVIISYSFSFIFKYNSKKIISKKFENLL